MSKKPLFSVIVPTYNNESRIKKCINSLLRQTVQDFEIVIVNDGSTDSTLETLQKSYGNNPKIRIFSQGNSGPSSARNTGIKHAAGTYIIFADADDWAEPTMLHSFLETIRSNPNLDFIINDQYEAGGPTSPGYSKGILTDHFQIIEGIIAPDYSKQKYTRNFRLFRRITGKLYLSDIIKRHGLAFPEEITALEDGIFNLNYLQLCETPFYNPEPTYHYTSNDGSITHSLNHNQANESSFLIKTIHGYLTTNKLSPTSLKYFALNAYRDTLNAITSTNGLPYSKRIHSLLAFDKHNHRFLALRFCSPYLRIKGRILLLMLKLRLCRTLILLYSIKNRKCP